MSQGKNAVIDQKKFDNFDIISLKVSNLLLYNFGSLRENNNKGREEFKKIKRRTTQVIGNNFSKE